MAGTDPMQNHMNMIENSPHERERAAITVARLSLSADDPHADCRLLLEACGLLDYRDQRRVD